MAYFSKKCTNHFLQNLLLISFADSEQRRNGYSSLRALLDTVLLTVHTFIVGELDELYLELVLRWVILLAGLVPRWSSCRNCDDDWWLGTTDEEKENDEEAVVANSEWHRSSLVSLESQWRCSNSESERRREDCRWLVGGIGDVDGGILVSDLESWAVSSTTSVHLMLSLRLRLRCTCTGTVIRSTFDWCFVPLPPAVRSSSSRRLMNFWNSSYIFRRGSEMVGESLSVSYLEMKLTRVAFVNGFKRLGLNGFGGQVGSICFLRGLVVIFSSMLSPRSGIYTWVRGSSPGNILAPFGWDWMTGASTLLLVALTATNLSSSSLYSDTNFCVFGFSMVGRFRPGFERPFWAVCDFCCFAFEGWSPTRLLVVRVFVEMLGERVCLETIAAYSSSTLALCTGFLPQNDVSTDVRWGEEPRDRFETADKHDAAEQCERAEMLETPEPPDATEPTDETRLVRPLMDRKATSALQPESLRRASLCMSVSWEIQTT